MLRGALDPAEVRRLNEAYDRFPPLSNGEWVGNAQRHDYTQDTGFELHHVLLALTDIGPGDGATMAIPGRHKVQPPPSARRGLRPWRSDGRGAGND